MIINKRSKRGILNINLPSREKEIRFVDFATGNTTVLEDYAAWRVEAFSPNGKKIALTRSSAYSRAERTDLVVMTVDDQNVQLNTHSYYVYDAAFNVEATRIILVTAKKKPFYLDLESNQIAAELPGQIRIYKGDLDDQLNAFFAPCEKLRDTCYLFSFDTGQTETIRLGVKERISCVKFSTDLSAIYVITETNNFYCFDRQYNLRWVTDFNQLGKKDGRINASNIFSTEDDRYLCLPVSSTEANAWGVDYVIDSAGGDIVRRIESYQFRGRIATNFFGNNVLLYTLQTLDLITGETADIQLSNL